MHNRLKKYIEVYVIGITARPWSHYVWNLAANRQSNDDCRGFGRSCGHTACVQNGYRSI